QSLSLAFGPQNFLVTYHAATRGDEVPAHAFAEILEALEAFPQSHVVFTGSNADTNGRIIGSLIEDWVRRFPSRAHFFHNLGYRRYVSLMRQVDAVIGNSSSGLIEAPAVGVPTVNVGDRQKGRLRAPSVIDCIPRAENVKDAIRRALIPEFRDAARTQPHPFGNGTASARILQTLKQQSLEVGAPKSFFAIPLTKDL
ncbi:MAG TPA: UDP-N-acetylglucosamine 2-epimerase, partial [Candidatus Ozemobacteraceae bacterium]|nr:UDP-N-acetylglucosamine 2-epimerase [Candidatus Ozemobacteraceae bacterium]